MSDTNDSASRTEAPTATRLARAREKGDVAKSHELAPLASLAAVGAIIAMAGGTLFSRMAVDLIPFLSHPDTMRLENGGALSVARHALMIAAPVVAAVMFGAGAAGAAGNLIQTGFLFAPNRLAPSLSKISPAAGFKRLFGLDAFVNFLRSLAKVAATGAIAWWVLKPHTAELANLAQLEPMAMLAFAGDVLRRLLWSILAFLLVIALLDWIWQRQRYLERMKMSREEVKEEFRQTEGDPHVKARQRQIRHERARRRMMQAVPTATVVIMNPTHFAVALRYEEDETAAPLCVAKGVDSLALKIREIAEEAGVPVIEDPPLARALYATVEVDELIPPAHYRAVAKVIGFVLHAGRRAPTRRP